MRFRFSTLLATALVTAPVAAQQDSARARDSVSRIPDLTVTTTRSKKNLLDQPLAITKVSASDWYGSRSLGLDDALTGIPGVLAQNRAGWSDVRLVIRGYGARGAGDRSNAGTSRGVRVLVDGFPETEPDGRTAFDLIDLAGSSGIDVIRSNSSALWGNAAGGVVSVSTVRGGTRPWFTFEPAFGSFGFKRFSTAAGYQPGNGELGFSITYAENDGYRQHSSGERLIANLNFNTPVGERSRVGIFASAGYNKYDIPGPLTADQVAQDPTQANAAYVARDERRDNTLGRLGVTYETALSDAHELLGSIYVQPKFLQRSERGTFRDFTRYHVGGNLTYRWNARFSEKVGSVLSVGVDEAYQDGAILFYNLTPDNQRGTLRTDKREGANNFGIYAQEELAIGSRMSLSLGARYDEVKYIAEDYLETLLTGEKTFSRVSPKIGFNYRLSGEQSLYLNVGGGIEAPAGNETDPAPEGGADTVYAINPLLDAISSTTYEVGTRHISRLGDGSNPWEVSWDAAGYYTDVRNEIVPYRGGRFYFTAGQAGRTGLELGARVKRGAIGLEGSLSLNHHEYLDYVVDSVHYGKPGATADYAGNKVVGVPDFIWSAGLRLTPKSVQPVSASLNVQGISSYFVDDANSVNVDGYTLVGLTFALDRAVRLSKGGFGMRGFVTLNNLFDSNYIASAFLNPDLVGGQPAAYEPGTPRSVVVSVQLGWQ
jgi:iron complex outermembrane receptor protein